jgi:protein-S-isoprenylcysteine O-methyltransferase Ste14
MAMMIARLLVSTAGMLIVMGAILFASAGTWAWPGAWAFLITMAVSSLGLGLWLARYDRALLAARLGSPIARAQSPWDRLFMLGAGVAFCAWMAFIGWRWRDAHESDIPAWLQVAGFILVAACMALALLTFRANSFAAPVVKLQSGQTVASTGPYRFVRHPMYAGALLYFLGVPLLLGVWAGLLATPFLAFGLGLRAVGEERVLRAGLAGYADYARRVRYRFVPLVW